MNGLTAKLVSRIDPTEFMNAANNNNIINRHLLRNSSSDACEQFCSVYKPTLTVHAFFVGLKIFMNTSRLR